MSRYFQYLITLLACVQALPLEPRSISGPVISSNFPDPSFIEVDGAYYAFSTTNGKGIPWAASCDFKSWEVSDQPAMAAGGSWTNSGNLWAPSVSRIGNQFVMYYSAPGSSGKHCIGAAVASVPNGPYTPFDQPLVCNDQAGGAIDPFGYTDVSGKNWLLYKIDGNSIGHGGSCGNGNQPQVSTPIMIQLLDGSGTVKQDDSGNGGGSTTLFQLLDRDDRDGPLVEAPSLLRAMDGASEVYFLFFSSGCYAESTYDTSYAVSRNGLLGPYVKAGAPTAPILRTGYPQSGLYAPGGLSTGIGGDNRVLFHADLGTTVDVRQMYAGYLNVNAAAGTVTLT